MKVIWTPQALQDRCDVWDHIATESLRAAIRMDALFSATAWRHIRSWGTPAK